MATVYLAEDRKHAARSQSRSSGPDLALQLGAERFLREIGIAAKLTHPHILPLHRLGDAGGTALLRHAVRGGRVAAPAADS